VVLPHLSWGTRVPRSMGPGHNVCIIGLLMMNVPAVLLGLRLAGKVHSSLCRTFLARTHGPRVLWTSGPVDLGTHGPWNPWTLWTRGSMDLGTRGSWNPWTSGLMDPRTHEPRDSWTPGLVNPRTSEPWDPWTPGLVNPRTLGPKDSWTLGLVDTKPAALAHPGTRSSSTARRAMCVAAFWIVDDKLRLEQNRLYNNDNTLSITKAVTVNLNSTLSWATHLKGSQVRHRTCYRG